MATVRGQTQHLVLLHTSNCDERSAISDALCSTNLSLSIQNAATLQEFEAALASHPDVAVICECDESPDAFALIGRQRESDSEPAVVFVMEETTPDSTRFALRSGADDCLGRVDLARIENNLVRALELHESRRCDRRAIVGLKEIADRFGLALRSSEISTWSWNAVDNQIVWDDRLHALFGLSPDAVPNQYQEYLDLILPEDRKYVDAQVTQALEEDRPYKCEYRVRWPDGSIHWLQARGRVHRGSDGNPIRMSGACWDVSVRRQAEIALQEHAEMQTVIASLGRRALATNDLNGLQLEALAAASETLGADFARIETLTRDRSALTLTHGIGWDDGVVNTTIPIDGSGSHADYVLAIGNPLAVADVRGDRRFTPAPYLQRHGVVSLASVRIEGREEPYGVLSVDSRTQRTFNEDEIHFLQAIGNLIGMVMERNLVEDALRAEETRYRMIVETTSEWIWESDQSGRILFSNPSVEQILGYRPEELVGRAGAQLMHPDDRRKVESLRPRWIESRKGFQEIVLRMRRRDGAWRDLECSARPVFDAHGEHMGFLGSARDVTARAQAEATTKRMAAELQQSNMDLEEFALIASHDLQEPLRKLQSFGGLLQEEYASVIAGDGAEYLAEIVSAAGRMQELVRSLLDLSRVGRSNQPFVSVSLNEALEDVQADLEIRIREADGKVSVAKLPDIQGNPIQIRQLFLNLISNALKFHRKGVTPVVHVTARRTHMNRGSAKSNGMWRIVVADNGIGFDPKHAEKVFTPFQRLHGIGVYEGTGMGLAICRKIVDRHGGTIRAESKPGQGSRFVLFLPESATKSE